MSVDNFIYDGVELRQKGFVVTRFDNGEDGEIDTDSQLSFNHISMFRGKYQPFITSQYEDVLVMEWWIMVDPCEVVEDEITGEETLKLKNDNWDITISQMRDLKKWLSRPTPHKLTIPDTQYENMYWMGSFTVEEYVYGDKRIGAHLTFECDAPFGYFENVVIEGTLDANESKTFDCESDEIGYTYPNVDITLLSSGDLQITDGNNRITEIKNCQAYERIIFTPELQITSSNPNHKIGDDFNYIFYRISNTYTNKANSFTCNLPCEYTITYKPIAKVVVV